VKRATFRAVSKYLNCLACPPLALVASYVAGSYYGQHKGAAVGVTLLRTNILVQRHYI